VAYFEAAAKRKSQQAFADLDRIVEGTKWGVAQVFDQKGRNARKWQSFRNKQRRAIGQERGLSGRALEAAVMAIAAADPSLVKIEAAGA
jgi:hypothetical protein